MLYYTIIKLHMKMPELSFQKNIYKKIQPSFDYNSIISCVATVGDTICLKYSIQYTYNVSYPAVVVSQWSCQLSTMLGT